MTRMLLFCRRPLRTLAAGLLAVGLSATALADAIPGEDDAPRGPHGGLLVHAITPYGDPARYPADFAHWDYVNPDAPKGGQLTMAAFGSFDSLNSYITRGTAAAGVDLIYDSLISGNSDEVRTYYADLAETVEIAEDRSWLVATLRDGAYFHDGTPITAHDVVFTHETLRDHGAPRFRTRFYEGIASIEALDDRTVRFEAANRDNPNVVIQIATFPVLPAHWWEGRDFEAVSLAPPLGSGPYRIAEVDPGRAITYERVTDYWAADLPQNRGMWNFDRIRYDYYRDQNVMQEAFKGGLFDFMTVTSSQEWATGFDDLRPVRDGRLILEEIPSTDPAGFSGFWFNQRRDHFRDPRVREAIVQFYDFETAQRSVHYGLYERLRSYFPNTELEASGLPEGREREILESFGEAMPAHILDEEFALPRTDGSGSIRPQMRRATQLLADAGWEVRDGRVTHVETGRPLRFEILFVSPNMERVINPLVRNLQRGGIEATPRLVDSAQFGQRINEFDYDVIMLGLRPFFPPGPELRGLWGSYAVDTYGNENFAGVADPVIDALVEFLVAAESWDEMVAAARALDRYLLWQHITIPTYFDDAYRVAYWDMFARPDVAPRYGYGFPETWWFDDGNPGALPGQRRR